MAGFSLKRVGVAMLGVRDLNRSASFYRDSLGLPLMTQFPRFAFFDAGNVSLVLSEPLAKAKSPVAGATEVVFSVPAVTQAYESLRANGVQFRNEPRNVNGADWAANFDDPDGHTLSIYGPRKA
jgi:catechol 2,3-dioxygenase-like lactoylglutathione lyase family enzyme